LSPKVQKEKSGRDAMRLVAGFGALGVMALAAWPLAAAEMRGVTATEIKIGQTMPAPRNSPTLRNIRKRPWACRRRSVMKRGFTRAMRSPRTLMPKFAVLSQNDDYGRDYLLGLKDVLGDKYDSVVTGATYEVSDPTIDSQIVKLKASGADVFVIAVTPKFAAQAIRKTHEIGWEPMRFLSNTAVWISSVMIPAGVEAGTGIISTAYVKDSDDPAWADDAGVKGWREFMTKYVPEADQHDTNYVNAYNSAMVLEAVLEACGDDLSTENILPSTISNCRCCSPASRSIRH
jgi:Periplasmic binding protein